MPQSSVTLWLRFASLHNNMKHGTGKFLLTMTNEKSTFQSKVATCFDTYHAAHFRVSAPVYDSLASSGKFFKLSMEPAFGAF